jgi:hypothetical protein
VTDILLKPFQEGELLAAIARALAKDLIGGGSRRCRKTCASLRCSRGEDARNWCPSPTG